jgi:hypothetical protein
MKGETDSNSIKGDFSSTLYIRKCGDRKAMMSGFEQHCGQDKHT